MKVQCGLQLSEEKMKKLCNLHFINSLSVYSRYRTELELKPIDIPRDLLSDMSECIFI